jgi:hypothetical protein
MQSCNHAVVEGINGIIVSRKINKMQTQTIRD